jgi:hypothetical protein
MHRELRLDLAMFRIEMEKTMIWLNFIDYKHDPNLISFFYKIK